MERSTKPGRLTSYAEYKTISKAMVFKSKSIKVIHMEGKFCLHRIDLCLYSEEIRNGVLYKSIIQE